MQQCREGENCRKSALTIFFCKSDSGVFALKVHVARSSPSKRIGTRSPAHEGIHPPVLLLKAQLPRMAWHGGRRVLPRALLLAGLKTKTLRSSSSLGAPDNTPNCPVVFVRFKIKEAAGREEVRKRKDVALRSIGRMIGSTDEGSWSADGVRLGHARELEKGATTRLRRTGWPGVDATGVRGDVGAELGAR